MSSIAIVPARGGSKRIPRKNIRVFRGRPIIHWPIETALSCGLFDEVIVSTDDAEIAEIAAKGGAAVPFLRPPELADDHTSTALVVQHAMQWLADQGRPCATACCIYPTAVFLSPNDRRRSFDVLLRDDVDYVLAITEYTHPVHRALIENADGQLQPLWGEFRATRTQDLPTAFHDAGQFCWGREGAFRSRAPVLGGRTSGWKLQPWRAVDIDVEDDWHLAERLHAAEMEH